MTTTLASRSEYNVGTWTLDLAHSELSFTVRHLAISKVRGTFTDFEVTVVTPEDPSQLSVIASVDMSSVHTGQEARDNHLRTSDFFLVEEHPRMTFTSTGITTEGDGFALSGDLTLRGITQPVTLNGEFAGTVTDEYGRTKAAASATTKINRSEFGVNWNAALEAGGFTLGEEITVSFEIQLVLDTETAAA